MNITQLHTTEILETVLNFVAARTNITKNKDTYVDLENCVIVETELVLDDDSTFEVKPSNILNLLSGVKSHKLYIAVPCEKHINHTEVLARNAAILEAVETIKNDSIKKSDDLLNYLSSLCVGLNNIGYHLLKSSKLFEQLGKPSYGELFLSKPLSAPSFSFCSPDGAVSTLTFIDGCLSFEGNADESGKIFLKALQGQVPIYESAVFEVQENESLEQLSEWDTTIASKGILDSIISMKDKELLILSRVKP
jgi:hypothetical protein